jgi:flagellar biosynthesis/type III secretory pathway M-ring protein FliF/YscJ
MAQRNINQRLWQPRKFVISTASANGVLSAPFLLLAAIIDYGSATARAVLYDNASAQSGDSVTVASNADTMNYDFGPTGVEYANGLSVTLTGAGSPRIHIIYMES